jgi:hypothetical protein
MDISLVYAYSCLHINRWWDAPTLQALVASICRVGRGSLNPTSMTHTVTMLSAIAMSGSWEPDLRELSLYDGYLSSLCIFLPPHQQLVGCSHPTDSCGIYLSRRSRFTEPDIYDAYRDDAVCYSNVGFVGTRPTGTLFV